MLFIVSFSFVKAAPDNEITYHGKLTDTSDVPVADGNYDFTIRIFDAVTGGSCVWSARGTCGTPTAKSVSVSKGIFYTILGESGDNALNLDFNSNYWVEIKVGTNSPMSPRRKITATSHAINSSKLDGQSSSYYLDTSATEQTKSGNLNIGGNVSVTGTYKDKDGDVGTSGQVLSSTVTGTDWVDGGSAGSDEYSEINLDSSRKIGSPSTVTTLDKAYDYIWSAGLFSGFGLTDNGNGTVDIAAGEGVLRTSASSTAPLHLVSVSGSSGLSLTDGAANFIYVDYNSGSPTISVGTATSDFNDQDKSILYRVSRDGNSIHYIDMMANNVDSNRSYRRKDFEMRGIDVGSGAVVSETGNRYLDITAGSFWTALSRVTTPAFDTSGTDTFDLYYRDGAGGWTKTTESQIDNLYYDDNSGTLATLANGRFATRFVFMVVSETGAHPAVVVGQASHRNRARAENENVPGDLPPEIDAIGSILAKVVFRKDDINFRSVFNAEDYTFDSALPTTHNSLAGNQGGTTDEYYHMTYDEHTNITTFINSTSMPSSDGSAGQVLTTDGNGTASWGDVSVGLISDIDDDTKIQVEESADEDYIRFDTAGNERMVIDDSGDIGIGIALPTNTIDIATSGESDGISFNGNVAVTANSGDTFMRLNNNSDFTGGVYTPGVMRIDGGMNVDDRSMISGDGVIHTAQNTTDSNYGYFEVRNNTGTRGAYFGWGNGSSYVDLKLDNSNDLNISGGDVGFSQSSPTARVHIVGATSDSSAYALKVDDSSSSNLFSIRNDGEISFGGYFSLEDGMYNDWNYPVSTLGFGSGSNPDIIDLASTNLEVAAFDGSSTTEEVSGVVEINHNYEEGTDIVPHIHWYPTTADSGTVRWQLEYTILYSGDTASTSTTIAIDDATDSTAWKGALTNFAAIDGTGLTIGGQIHFRLFRDPTHTNDTYGADAAAATLGFHYKADTIGSKTTSSK